MRSTMYIIMGTEVGETKAATYSGLAKGTSIYALKKIYKKKGNMYNMIRKNSSLKGTVAWWKLTNEAV